jgi:type VI secretion system protein ImpM
VLHAAQAEVLGADALAALLPPPGTADPAQAPSSGWWTAGSSALPGLVWPLAGLPEPSDFVLLLEAAA